MRYEIDECASCQIPVTSQTGIKRSGSTVITQITVLRRYLSFDVVRRRRRRTPRRRCGWTPAAFLTFPLTPLFGPYRQQTTSRAPQINHFFRPTFLLPELRMVRKFINTFQEGNLKNFWFIQFSNVSRTNQVEQIFFVYIFKFVFKILQVFGDKLILKVFLVLFFSLFNFIVFKDVLVRRLLTTIYRPML